MTKKHRKTGKARRTTMKKPFCNALKLEHLYLTPRKKRRGVILRDNCKLYAAENAEDLKKYLKEKGLI